MCHPEMVRATAENPGQDTAPAPPLQKKHLGTDTTLQTNFPGTHWSACKGNSGRGENPLSESNEQKLLKARQMQPKLYI